ncbi:MAG: 1-acyl-sn-glycerol-3-phosphate acyltransferase, partial [Nitrospinota bacterium]
NRVIDELNVRLQLKIQPFKLTKRQVLIDRLLYDPEVIKAAEALAVEKGRRREEVMVEVGRYAREIVPSFNAYAYFRLAYGVARFFGRMLYRVRLGYSDEAGLSKVDPDASVVFVMNHRSNMDYILVAYLAATRSALSYAVGEWARIWPLQALIKSMGAYFIRRNSSNPLYRKVLARYVHMATEGGVVQAVYPEGRLTRDGKLQPLKLGLISYMVSSFNPHGERDLLFIPVGINYDRVLEDRSLVRRLDPSAEKKSGLYAAKTTLKFLLHNFNLMARRRWYRFGYAGVNFGTPVSMRSYLERKGFDFRTLDMEKLFEEVEALGSELIDAVGKVIPVLPVSLVATVILKNEGRRISELELKAEVLKLIHDLESAGAHVYIPRSDQGYSVSVGLRMLTLRHIVVEKDGLYSAKPEELALLRYYANAIAHLLTPSG